MLSLQSVRRCLINSLTRNITSDNTSLYHSNTTNYCDNMSKIELRPKVDNIPTKVSQDQRLSLQVNYRSPDAQNKGGPGRPRSISSIVPVIDEDKILDTSKPPRFERNNSMGSNSNPYRKSSSSTTNRPNNNGIVNGGFVDSRPPSIYGGSVNSLP